MGLGLAGLMAVAVLAVGGGHAPASARSIVFGTDASNKRLAEVQAERELPSFRVPPRARRVWSSPAPILDGPLGLRGEPNLIRRWKWLVAPGTVSGTLRWFRAHPPRGSFVEEEDHGAPESASSILFSVAEHSRRAYGPIVIPTVARLSGHRVGILLEVQQVWRSPHPAAAKVPAAARFLYVSRDGKSRRQVIRAPRRVRRIAHVIDQLPSVQPQMVYCPEFFGAHVDVTMRFKAREGGLVLAEASQEVPEACGLSMSLTVGGGSRSFGLDDGERVVELLHR
jgi:hypothetical protein